MPTTLLSISPQGYQVYFLLFSSLIVILASVVYVLLRSSKYRRPQFSGGTELSAALALLLVAPLAGASLWYVYDESWGYFYTLESDSGTVNIGYYYPKRKVTLDETNNVSIHTTSHMRKSGAQHRLILRLASGEEHVSQMISQRQIERVVATLEAALNAEADSN